MLDLITVGDGIIDAFLSIHDADIHCHVDEKKCEIAFTLGDKIPLDSCDFQLGGNGANVAVGLSRLGFQTGLMAEIGDDAFATNILNNLHTDHVSLEHVKQLHGKSSFAVGIQSDQERVLFVKHEKREHDFQFASLEAKWMYLTSLGNAWEEAYKKAYDCVNEKSIHMAFSPGTLQLEAGREKLMDMLGITEILFLNRDEGQKLLAREESSIEALLTALHTLGPRIIVVTDGKEGSYVYDDGGNMYYLSICVGEVVEKTGAGDAYASGFMAAYLLGSEMTTCMKWGTVNAAQVITKIGAQAGLMDRETLEQMLRGHKELIAKKL